MSYALTLRSDNSKTGPIPVSVSTDRTCPPSCGLWDECYAKGGKTVLHWAKVSSGARGLPWDAFCSLVSTLPMGQLWRHNISGDLPGVGDQINGRMLRLLVLSQIGRRGFTYTHKPPTPDNIAKIRAANDWGFTVSLSANSPTHADKLARHGLPVVTVVASDQMENFRTPRGRLVVICPASKPGSSVTCSTCQLCSRRDHPIVGFPAHGSKRRIINIKLAA
jgi:hypothetical protein